MEALQSSFASLIQFYRSHPGIGKALTVLGGVQAALLTYDLLRTFWMFFHPSSTLLKKYKGKWALVTGATWGIGHGFAKEIARQGLNVVLIARSADRLQEVAKELETQYHVQTKIIVADFANNNAIEVIKQALGDLEISLLVNNVGIALPMLYYEECPIDDIVQLVEININALNRMTHLILPQMKQRRDGIIINLSSMSSVVPFPFQTAYSGSKAYINQFSKSLSIECAPFGIKVMCVAPSFVTSKLTRVRKPTLSICSEDKLARLSLNQLGYTNRTNPYWVHALQEYFVYLFPSWSASFALKLFGEGRRKHLERTHKL